MASSQDAGADRGDPLDGAPDLLDEGDDGPTPDAGHDPVPTLAPLRVAEYRHVWLAAVVSHLGTFLQMTAAPWIVLELTGSAFLVSLVTAALLFPRLVLTLPAGALADVVDRRTLLVVGNLVGAAAVGTMAVLAHLDLLGPVSVLLLTLLLGSGSAVAMPAFQTLVPDLVPRSLLPQAITLNSGAFNVARAVGPALGGALVAAGLASLAFGLNTVSFVVVVGVLLTLPRDEVAAATRTPRTLLRATVTGVRYARFTPRIRRLLVLAGVFALTAAPVQALLAPASVELGLDSGGFGLLWGVFGGGALLGVLLRERVRVLLGTRMVPVSLALFGVGGMALGLAPTALVAAAGLAVAGLAWVWVLITLNATVQLLAPGWVRSRVVSIYALVVGLQPIGAFLAGALAEQTGAGVAIALSTAVTLVTGVVAARADLPVLGEIDEPRAAGLGVRQELVDADVTGPVVVDRTWRVEEADVEEFLALVRRARGIRLRTGARRWELRRDAFQPGLFFEEVEYVDWDEHVVQRTRLEQHDLALLRRLWSLDVDGAPHTTLQTPMEL